MKRNGYFEILPHPIIQCYKIFHYVFEYIEYIAVSMMEGEEDVKEQKCLVVEAVENVSFLNII